MQVLQLSQIFGAIWYWGKGLWEQSINKNVSICNCILFFVNFNYIPLIKMLISILVTRSEAMNKCSFSSAVESKMRHNSL